jgi:hypothetical protein
VQQAAAVRFKKQQRIVYGGYHCARRDGGPHELIKFTTVFFYSPQRRVRIFN